MNLLTCRTPNHTIMEYACEYGLGTFYVESERVWRYAIPDHLQGRAHINLLEFLIQVVHIWLDFIEGRITSDSCILTMGDNTTAMEWIWRSNFREVRRNKSRLLCQTTNSKKIAKITLQAKACLYS